MIATTPQGNVVWSAQAGPQTWLLACPCSEILFGGARGGGKTDAILGDFAVYALRYGAGANGLIFRRDMTELEELIDRSYEIYEPLGAKYEKQAKTWRFPNGARLRMRYLDKPRDAMKYQGRSLSWVAVDEAGTYATDGVINLLRAAMRSTRGVPTRLILTANPGGPGHQWLRERYIDGKEPLVPWIDKKAAVEGQAPPYVVYIPSKVTDNKILMENDPTYIGRIRASGPEWLVEAWLNGRWDIAASGGILDPDKILRMAQVPIGVKYLACDPAFTGKDRERRDRSAITIGGMDETERVWCTHMEADHLEPNELIDRIVELVIQHKVRCVLLEGGPGGRALEPFLREELMKRCPGVQYEIISHAGGDKAAKATTLVGLVGAGNFCVPENVPWWPEMRDEFWQFNGEDDGRDDIVDSAGILARKVDKMRTPHKQVERAPSTVPDFKLRQRELKKRGSAFDRKIKALGRARR
jgi:predicted phage terminase large subunit-like protein